VGQYFNKSSSLLLFLCVMKVVSAGIIENDGKILIAQRDSGSLAGLWEFPGGKLEGNETPEKCLLRELDEELGLSVRIKGHFSDSEYEYSDGKIQLMVFVCSLMSGPTKMESHSAIRWIDPKELLGINLVPADFPIAKKYIDILSQV